MEDAFKEFVSVLDKIGSGRCLHRDSIGYLQSAKTCNKLKKFSPSSHYCDDLENSMQCHNHLEDCYTEKNLNKFKYLEFTVQTIGVISDEVEDKLQDCPIYTQQVGLRNSIHASEGCYKEVKPVQGQFISNKFVL